MASTSFSVLPRRMRSYTALATLPLLLLAGACNGGASGGDGDKQVGATEFTSSPPLGQTASRGTSTGGDMSNAGSESAPAADPSTSGGAKDASSTRTVEETDLYRYDEGTQRLYVLNGYRGLLVFDVADMAHPKLLGRSPILGTPVEMYIQPGTGIATVVVADWYGSMEDGTPFHGSIVRGIDATDPTNIKILGEAKLGGWVRDTRIVGKVLYAVSQDYGWYYGWGDTAIATPGGGAATSSVSQNSVIVSSVSFADGIIEQKSKESFAGYGGVFNVTQNAILFAHDIPVSADNPWQSSGKTELQYIDITDPGGAIKLRGKVTVNGSLQAWGTDNGRWNLDFADGRTAHVVGCGGTYCGSGGASILGTADFTDPDAPKVASELSIQSTGWSYAARFVGTRLYLSPSDSYYYGSNGNAGTPVQIYDLAVPADPKFAGQTTIAGSVWNFTPNAAGDRLFALGSDYTPGQDTYGGKIALRYIDVTDPKAPSVLGNATFGEGWAWTPAASTFKAFGMHKTLPLIALPFSGWSSKDRSYNNGVQILAFDATTIRAAGAAKTRGWVERGVWIKDRLVSLSDQALSVIDYTNVDAPKVEAELVLARNVVDVRASGGNVAQLSTDWWGYDSSSSELRVVAGADIDNETKAALAEVSIEGTNARAFRNGELAYVVTTVTKDVPCDQANGGAPSGAEPMPAGDTKGGAATCSAQTEQVTVVDLTGGKATVRGKLALEQTQNWYGYAWGGCFAYDWYYGADVVSVGDALAFRRTKYSYENGQSKYSTKLYVVDLKKPDAPSVASMTVVDDDYGWWGSMKAAGNKLYTTHYEWIDRGTRSYVKYFLDEIDLTQRDQPKIGKRYNIPGIFVGASEKDPTEIYTIDYRWYDQGRGYVKNDFNVLKLDGDKARLLSSTALAGWVGNVFVRGSTAITSTQRYDWDPKSETGESSVRLVQLDLTDARKPVVKASQADKGWGWLIGVEGDRALLSSGWGQTGVDIYRLSATTRPTFEKFVRTRGYWTSDTARDGNRLYLASGFFGVEAVDIAP